MEYYDDNFGHWEGMQDEEAIRYYKYIQQTNVEKECNKCGRMVSIQPQYAICNSCAERLERGEDW